MSGYDPSDFQDLASLTAFKQRANQLDALNKQADVLNEQAQQLAELKNTLRQQKNNEEAEKRARDELFKLKLLAQQINETLSRNSFLDAYDLIMNGRRNLGFANQGLFSSLEYKELAIEIQNYFQEIYNYFTKIVPKEVLDEIEGKEALKKEHEKKLAEDARQRHLDNRRISHKMDLARIKGEKQAKKQARKEALFLWGGIGAIMGIIFILWFTLYRH